LGKRVIPPPALLLLDLLVDCSFAPSLDDDDVDDVDGFCCNGDTRKKKKDEI
jgi:hypothetical protein